MPKPTLNLTSAQCLKRTAYPTKDEAIVKTGTKVERCCRCWWWHGVKKT